MARVSMVTRTIVATNCTALCINVETAEPFNKVYTISKAPDDEKKLIKMLQKMEDDENVKVVHVVDTEVEEKLYGMPETDFIKYAEVLPPRGTKVE